jgi:hypothetical protein
MNNWPIDPPSVANPNLGNIPSPMLPPDGGYAENRRDFAAKAFELFGAKLIQRIQAVNTALRNYHSSGGGPQEYAKYRKACLAYRNFIKHPVIKEGFNKALDPPPARVFAIEGLEVETRIEGDYCVAVSFSGTVVFSAGGPVGVSSSSSSSRPTLPGNFP